MRNTETKRGRRRARARRRREKGGRSRGRRERARRRNKFTLSLKLEDLIITVCQFIFNFFIGMIRGRRRGGRRRRRKSRGGRGGRRGRETIEEISKCIFKCILLFRRSGICFPLLSSRGRGGGRRKGEKERNGDRKMIRESEGMIIKERTTMRKVTRMTNNNLINDGGERRMLSFEKQIQTATIYMGRLRTSVERVETEKRSEEITKRRKKIKGISGGDGVR
jgi:hypothetical protein